MIIGVNIPEKEFESMTDGEKLRMLKEAYGRSKTAKYKAMNYMERLDLLGCPLDRMHNILDDRQASLVKMLIAGLME